LPPGARQATVEMFSPLSVRIKARMI
jgi:hypothetical protein